MYGTYAPTGARRLDSENWETFEKHTRAMSFSANIGWTAIVKILTVVYHLPKKSRNFKWYVNRKINFVFPKGNFLEEKGISWKVDQKSQTEFPNVNSMFHLLWDNLGRNSCIPVATNWTFPVWLPTEISGIFVIMERKIYEVLVARRLSFLMRSRLERQIWSLLVIA